MDQRRRKLYLALLGLAAAGLVIDRFVLTQSATAPASAGIPASPHATTGIQAENAGKTGLPGGPSTSIPEIPFPRGLQTAKDKRPILDLFAPPHVRLQNKSSAGLSHNRGPIRSGAGLPERLSGAMFERRHTLEGVLVQQRLKLAVLNGRSMRIGDSIDGCKLTEVSGYEARFECDDGPVVLKLKGVGTRSPG